VLVASLGAGLLVGVVAVAALAILTPLRNLIFASMSANVDGDRRVARAHPVPQPVPPHELKLFLRQRRWITGRGSSVAVRR